MILAAASVAPVPAAADEPVPYVVKAGDTLSDLRWRYVVSERHWNDLMRLLKLRNPRRLPVGRTVSIPYDWLRWTPEKAQFASVRGTVLTAVGGRSAPATVGADVPEGAEISTAAGSFATLILSNGSKVALPSQSRVTVSRMRKIVINGALDYRFALAEGRVDTRVTPLKDKSGHFIITTPIAMTAVRGTEYAVAFDASRRSTGTAVFDGTVAVSPPDGSTPLLVPATFGAATDASGNSEKVKLSPAPDLQNPGKTQTDEQVVFDFQPVPGVSGYRVTLATDAGFVDSFAEALVSVPRAEIANVPNGNQFVRISAISDKGVEGLRQTYSFSRRLASIHAEAGAEPDGFRFKWFGTGEGERHYRLQIFRDRPEGTPIVDEVGLARSEATVRNLPPGVYFWRVLLVQTDADGTVENWTEPEKLTIAAPNGG